MATTSKVGYNDGTIRLMDERSGCRSLLCDSSGIIIAEMVYRCMACFSIHEYIGDVSKHYHAVHLSEKKEEPDDSANLTNEEDQDQLNNNTVSLNANVNHSFNKTVDNTATKIINNRDNNNNNNNSSNYLSDNSNNDESWEIDEKLHDNFKPNSHSIPNFVKLNNTIPNPSESCTRSGYIHCPVCSTIRCYTTLQRRYGQFTCVACYRFFKEFFLRPTRFSCQFLGQCPLDVKSKCKACWILACMKIYSVDSRRKSVLEAYAPIKANLPKVTITSSSPSFPSSSLPSSSLLSSSLPSSSSSSSSIYIYPNENCKPVKLITASALPIEPDDKKSLISSNLKDTCNFGNKQSTESTSNIVNQETSKKQPFNTNMLTCEEKVPPDCDEAEDESDANQNIQSFIKEENDKSIATTFQGFPGQTIKVIDFRRITPKIISKKPDRRSKIRVKNWCCLKCANCLADDCGKCINCLDRPKFGGPFVRKQRCVNKKCLEKIQSDIK
ncbi:integrator complex subunit 4 homolog [Tetranychus urticae]|uniref:Nuclear receptor domain-containing protein n=1 Tax=Tetranychus urticae TaxID=32264 RepID=T1JU25_TETUR|nr:integrator complex subunit 4 homolog [Tetranychus urticae]